jgi:hypothetical protein
MPMFYTPKPRQFHYTPRFYDPEKEKWEALKKKYSNQQSEGNGQQTETTDAELAYFEQRVREIENEEKRERQKLGFSDLFRRRKMPTFNYQPRFQSGAGSQQATDGDQQAAVGADSAILDKYSGEGQGYKTRKIKIRRRFDMGDSDYMKPVSGGKIILYALLACLLLYLILF